MRNYMNYLDKSEIEKPINSARTQINYETSLIKQIYDLQFNEINIFYKKLIDILSENLPENKKYMQRSIESKMMIGEKIDSILGNFDINEEILRERENKKAELIVLRTGYETNAEELIETFRKKGYLPANLHQLLASEKVFPWFKKSSKGLFSYFKIGGNSSDHIFVPYMGNDSRYDPDWAGLHLTSEKHLKEKGFRRNLLFAKEN